MKRLNLILGLLVLLGFVAHGQVAERKHVNKDEHYKYIDRLLYSMSEKDKVELAKEAKSMAKSKEEQDIIIARLIYERLDNKQEEQKMVKKIYQKFPRGNFARFEASKRFFNLKNLSAAQWEEACEKFLKDFPEKECSEKYRSVYGFVIGHVGLAFAKEKNDEKTNHYLNEMIGRKNYVPNVCAVAKEFVKDKEFKRARILIQPVFDLYSQKKKNREADDELRHFTTLSETYASILSETGDIDQAITIIKDIVGDNPLPRYMATYSILLDKQGKSLDAFNLLEKEVLVNGKDSVLLQSLLKIYSKLNSNLSDTTEYLRNLDQKIHDRTLVKLRSEMINRVAPAFNLLNRSGQEVSLEGLKGKIVVLDFWATWCGPCVASFPGMQAAVDKYANDKEVEFLFINTRQSEINYKELVDKFIDEKNYSFNVLYDEMKNREKAVATAYNVLGIPAKVIIDKKGYIRFQSSGGGSDVQKIVNELSAKIELAKES